jgi:hypothetical protein
MENTVIYLLGLAGTGKYTIAKEICRQQGFHLVDNHLINNPVFSLIELDRKLPERVWQNTGKIWDVVIDTMLHLSPPDYSFVLTNELCEDDKNDKAWFQRVVAFIAERKSHFVPVRLSISETALLQRCDTPERRARMKDTNRDRARLRLQEKQVLLVEHDNVLNLDVSDIPPEEAARQIISHAQQAKKQTLIGKKT